MYGMIVLRPFAKFIRVRNFKLNSKKAPNCAVRRWPLARASNHLRYSQHQPDALLNTWKYNAKTHTKSFGQHEG